MVSSNWAIGIMNRIDLCLKRLKNMFVVKYLVSIAKQNFICKLFFSVWFFFNSDNEWAANKFIEKKQAEIPHMLNHDNH